MGLLKFLTAMVHCCHSIKIMSVDGYCKRYKAPLSVKEVLLKNPQHLLFNAETIQKLGSWARPLPESRLLEPGRLYVLIPTPTKYDTHDHEPPQTFHSMPLKPTSSSSAPASGVLRSRSLHEGRQSSGESRDSAMPPRRRRARVSFALEEVKEDVKEEVKEEENEAAKKKAVSLAESNKESMERRVSSLPHNLLIELDPTALVETQTQSLPRSVSPLDGNGVVVGNAMRVKVVVTKKQLETLMQDGGGEERRVLLESLASKGVEEAHNSTWKPSLDRILESKPCPGTMALQ